jgi:hypothetical protein
MENDKPTQEMLIRRYAEALRELSNVKNGKYPVETMAIYVNHWERLDLQIPIHLPDSFKHQLLVQAESICTAGMKVYIEDLETEIKSLKKQLETDLVMDINLNVATVAKRITIDDRRPKKKPWYKRIFR